MRKVNEIFYSLQGEGCHTGRPSVFLRFSGCNLKCPFCDTSHFSGTLMTDEEIFSEIMKHPGEWVILTGGEPALQIDREFVENLKKITGRKVAIETNGTIPLPENIDWITVSPKEGICGANPNQEEKGMVRTLSADEIKVVDTGQDLAWYFTLPCRKPHTLMYLQPCYVEDERQRESNLKRTIRRVLADPRWNLSVQMHRMVGIP